MEVQFGHRACGELLLQREQRLDPFRGRGPGRFGCGERALEQRGDARPNASSARVPGGGTHAERRALAP